VKSETKRTVKYSLNVLGGISVFVGLMNVWRFALRDMPLDSITVGLVVVGSACLWIGSEIMNDWQTVLAEQRASPQNKGIELLEVPAAELTAMKSDKGRFEARLENGTLTLKIRVDESLSDEFKTAVLFHELGHGRDYVKYEAETRRAIAQLLTPEEARIRKIRSETAAFQYCLQELRKIAGKGWRDPFVNTIKRISQRATDDPDPDYRVAIRELQKTIFWKDCVDEVKATAEGQNTSR
jgi:hypothetical protein